VVEAADAYRAAFRPSAVLSRPHLLVSADVVVAPTDAEARWLASPYGLWVRGRSERIAGRHSVACVGVILDQLSIPIVLAPLAGGPSTPELAAAVSEAGGFGFLAAGYLTARALAERLSRTRALTGAPIGVNVFVPGSPAEPGVAEAYAATLAADADDAGVALGAPRFDDDDWAGKIDLLAAAPPAVVSFTFGCPDRSVISSLQRVGSEVWVTVTTPGEARDAVRLGADALVLQGMEAGGHRGSFRDDPGAPADTSDGLGLLSLLPPRARHPQSLS
jgi:nitronate monooxygenase